MKPKFEIGQIVNRIGQPPIRNAPIINIYEVRTYKTKKVVHYLYEFEDSLYLYNEHAIKEQL